MLIAGVGNILMSDDGLGPRVIEYLERQGGLPDHVELADLGTPGLDLIPWLAGRDVVILVDAVSKGPGTSSPGEIRRYSREDLVKRQPGLRLNPHEPALADALMYLEFNDSAPGDVVLIGAVVESTEQGTSLTPALEQAVPRVADAVRAEMDARWAFAS
jgi:hydrogenase maturation protease